MRVFSERQAENASLLRAREEEIDNKVPGFNDIKLRLIDLNREDLNARMRKDTGVSERLSHEREKLIKEKVLLLNKYGYPADYLEPPCRCRLCSDKGLLPGGEKCSCFKQLEAELVNRQSGLPDFLKGVSVDSIPLDIYNNEAPMADLPKKAPQMTQREYFENVIIRRAASYVEVFDAPGSHNIFMTGAAGTGKTYIAAAIAQSLMDSLHTVIYESAGELASLYQRYEFNRGDIDKMESRLSLIEDCNLLIIDDLGTEFTTDVIRAHFFSLISHRLSGSRSTIITSNLNLNDIGNIYGERIASRISGNYLRLAFFGTDLRLASRLRRDAAAR